MNFNKLLSFFALLVIVGLSSCKEEPIDNLGPEIVDSVEPVVQTTNPLVYQLQSDSASSSTGGLDLGCVSIDFPFDLDVDGTIVTISDEEDFTDELFNGAEVVEFVYPLNVTLLDGSSDYVEDAETLGELFAACVPDTGWSNDNFPAYLICDINSCYQLVYPVGLLDADGNTFTANNEEEFIELIVEQPLLFFDFPIDLVDNDGEEITANNDEELFTLVASCQDNWDPGIDTTFVGGPGQFGCFQLLFPVSVLDADSNIVVLVDEDAFNNAILNGTILSFSYPVSFEDSTGGVITINTDEELILALISCGPDELFASNLIVNSSLNGNDCYDLIYPFDVTNMSTSEVTTIADDFGANSIMQSGEYVVVTPVEILLISTQEVISIEGQTSLISVLMNCQ